MLYCYFSDCTFCNDCKHKFCSGAYPLSCTCLITFLEIFNKVLGNWSECNFISLFHFLSTCFICFNKTACYGVCDRCSGFLFYSLGLSHTKAVKVIPALPEGRSISLQYSMANDKGCADSDSRFLWNREILDTSDKVLV